MAVAEAARIRSEALGRRDLAGLMIPLDQNAALGVHDDVKLIARFGKNRCDVGLGLRIAVKVPAHEHVQIAARAVGLAANKLALILKGFAQHLAHPALMQISRQPRQVPKRQHGVAAHILILVLGKLKADRLNIHAVGQAQRQGDGQGLQILQRAALDDLRHQLRRERVLPHD